MALDKHFRINGNSQPFAELGDTLRFVLASAIRKQDEGHFLRLEIFQSFCCAGDRLRASEKNTIDTEREKGWLV